MGIEDLRQALLTSAHLSDAYKQLNLHLDCLNTAKNILLIYIMLSDDFDPDNHNDLQYLWDVWYSFKWSKTTRNRFVNDVKQLMAGGWKSCGKIVLPCSKDIDLQHYIHDYLVGRWQSLLDLLAKNSSLPSQAIKIITERRYSILYRCI